MITDIQYNYWCNINMYICKTNSHSLHGMTSSLDGSENRAKGGRLIGLSGW